MNDQSDSKTPPNGDKPDRETNSEVVHEHRALMNQGTAKPEDYPQSERDAQSLVRKEKRRDRPD